MPSVRPELRLSPRDRPCRAHCSFDAGAALFSAEFELAGPEPAPRWVEQVERGLGIRARTMRLVLGDLDITFAPPGQLVAVDMRTSPTLWQRARAQVPAEAPALWFDPVVEFDDNELCVLDVAAVTSWDPDARALMLRFGGGEVDAPLRWFALADNVYAGLDAGARLCELMFTRVGQGPAPGVH